MKKPFKLKSGNISGGSSFKAMGATPGESPMQLGGLLRLGRFAYRALTGTRKLKKGGVVKDAAEELKKVNIPTTKKGKITLEGRKNIVESTTNTAKHNKSITRKSNKYKGKDLLVDAPLAAGAGYKYMTRKDPDGSTVEVGVGPGEVMWADEDSLQNKVTFKGEVPGNVKNKKNKKGN